MKPWLKSIGMTVVFVAGLFASAWLATNLTSTVMLLLTAGVLVAFIRYTIFAKD